MAGAVFAGLPDVDDEDVVLYEPAGEGGLVDLGDHGAPQQETGTPRYGGGGGMMGSGGMGWMTIFWLLLVLGVVVLVVVAVRAFGGGVTRPTGEPPPGGAGQGRSRARHVLDERYARGEITTEEYRERLAVLGEDAT